MHSFVAVLDRVTSLGAASGNCSATQSTDAYY